jgi:signal transduction histidine kinase
MSLAADVRDEAFCLARLEEEKLAALAEFAAGAGHEINNPLAVICGRAELLLRQETHPERRRDLATIHAQARRVYEMIADLMLFARPPRPLFAGVDLAALFHELAAELGPRCQEQGVILRIPPEQPPIHLRADRAQLLVALRAICDNALEVLEPGGRIDIRAELEEPKVHPDGGLRARIEIHDDGPGFDESIRRHLFDPFFSGRAAGRGLGVGLAKCWRIVRLHDGWIDVESQEGRGATFRVKLPAMRFPRAADANVGGSV